MTLGTKERDPKPRSAGMSPQEAAWLAGYMCAISLLLTAPGLFLLVLSRSPANASVYAGAPVFDYWLVNTIVAISFSTVGAVIAPRLPPHNPIGWLFCTIGLIAAMRLLVAEYAIVTLLAEPGSFFGKLPGGDAFAWISSWLWVVHLGLFVYLALLFPDGRPLARDGRGIRLHRPSSRHRGRDRRPQPGRDAPVHPSAGSRGLPTRAAA